MRREHQDLRLLDSAGSITDLLPLPLAGEGWGEGARNIFKHSISILKDFIVPEPQDAPSFRRKKCVSPFVSHTVDMLAAIQFNNEMLLDSCEVDNVRSNRDWRRNLVPFNRRSRSRCHRMRSTSVEF
ncbi:MAG: hypothetical protein OJF62_001355 [Pseudolabrys sp.]|jgi:hypothetical protein|nr:hypothetical protein [Pseudolabrys sp.]